MNRSRIIATLTLAIFLAPMSAAAQDAALPPHAVVVGAWQGSADGDELEIAIWFETENKFASDMTPTRSSGNFVAYASLKNGGCNEYLHGTVASSYHYGDDYRDIAAEHRGISFTKRGANGHLFADCRALTSLGLVVSVDSLDTMEFRNMYTYGDKSTLRRISASRALLEKAADGPPENPKFYVANSKPSAKELAIMRDAGASATGALAALAADLIPPPPPTPDRKALAVADPTRPVSIANFFLIDRHGVDQISSDGWSLGNGTVVREFGTNSAYMPGDKTREIGWREKEQTLLMYESVKYNRTSTVEVIRKGAISLTFQVDSERTQAAGGVIIWHATEEPSEGSPVCVRWERETSPETCREKRKGTREFYLTAGIDQAKDIFKELAPNARMIGREDSSETCVSGSICEHPGGDYVDAIIRGDMQRFRKLDFGASGFIREKIEELGIIGELFLTPHLDDESLSPLTSFVNEYLHEYKNNPKRCFKPGSQSFDFKEVTETLVEVDGMGNQTGHTYGGITMTSHYNINPEFFGICRQVCGLRNGGTEQLAGSTPVLLAARKFRKTYDCKSKEVQDFERNLIDFYGRKNEVYDFEVTRNSW